MSFERKKIRLFALQGNRDTSTSKDARLVNGFVEKGDEEGEVWVYKRPGLITYSQPSGGAATGRGCFYWRGAVYSVFGTTLYKDGTSKGTVDGTSSYTFTSCLGATPQLFLRNNAKAYVYDDGGGLVAVTDADYPATTVPGCAYLDGTTYIFDASANIHGSDLNAQSSWDPLNLLVAQIEPDGGVALAKQLVYVVALKDWSTEIFYDRGNATGSPLGPVQGAKINVGCRAAGSVRDVGGELAWVSTSREGSLGVTYMKNVKAQTVSTAAVERALQNGDFSTTWSWCAKVAGHRLYGVTLKVSNLSLVYDLTMGVWYQWTDASSNYFPIVDSTVDSNARAILQHESDGRLYRMDITAFQDNGSTIPFKLYTPEVDFGTRAAKQYGSLEIFADQVSGADLGMQFTDDDYTTWSTARTISDLNIDRPFFPDLGESRERAFLFTNSSNTFFRMRGEAEVLVDLGST